jgi:hypothetical protein
MKNGGGILESLGGGKKYDATYCSWIVELLVLKS